MSLRIPTIFPSLDRRYGDRSGLKKRCEYNRDCEPKTRNILLTSIPRNTYLPLHTYGAMEKLTHSGIYGIDETVSTVEDWLGVEMNYYVRINFSMLVKMVDAIGGIDVNSKDRFQISSIGLTGIAKVSIILTAKQPFILQERESHSRMKTSSA
ncbi:MAG: LCP family protein [Anaerovoracaceae bacterium]